MLNFYILIFNNKFKVFILTIILFLTTFMLIHIFSFEKFSRTLLKNDISKKRFDYVKKHGSKIEIAAIGTSHTDNGLIGNINLFNYGRMSTYFPQVAYSKAFHLMEYSPNLKALLLEIDHIDVFAYSSDSDLLMPDNHKYLLKNTTNLLYNTDIKTTKEPIFKSLQEDMAPVIHRKLIQEYLISSGEPKSKSIQWHKLLQNEKNNIAKKRVSSYNLDTVLNIDDSIYDYYNKTIENAIKKDINIFLILYPQTEEYLNEINNNNNIKLDEFISSLSSKKRVVLLDYRHIFKMKPIYFENQDHLNTKGAKVFTKIIQNDLKKVLNNEF